MKAKLLHTPEGVRDIYKAECKKKKVLEGKLHEVLGLYGYQDIETPAFEFFEVFNSDTGTVSSREMFKFFDRYNNTLVLRPDMTPSIARSVAKYYSDCEFPLRLSYVGNTYVNKLSYQGKLNERTELGAEHINDDSPEADAEAIVMMIDCFLTAGLKDFRVDIGQVAFYKAIMDAIDVDDQVKDQIHEYVENKNALGMSMLLSRLSLEENYRKILLEYNEFYGDVSMLEHVRSLTDLAECHAAIDRLEEVYELVRQYGYDKYISFDLGMVSHYDYYTGLIFRGYTYGTGAAIGKGGRYDNLLSQFGKNAAAIGLTIMVDELLSALSRQKIAVSIEEASCGVLLYDQEDVKLAIDLAKLLRSQGNKIELMKKTKPVEEYLNFFQTEGAIIAYDLHDGLIETYHLGSQQMSQTSVEKWKEENL